MRISLVSIEGSFPPTSIGEPSVSVTIPTLGLADGDPAEQAVDAVVIGVYSQEADAPAPLLLASGAGSVAVAFDGQLVETLTLFGAIGAVGQAGQAGTPR